MKIVELKNIAIKQPDIDEYNEFFPRMRCNTQNKQALFNLITDPNNIHRALIFVEETGKSPVFVYENKIKDAIHDGLVTQLTDHEKQFVGAATCVVMKTNDFDKTGRKQRFTKGIFSSAELYVEKRNL